MNILLFLAILPVFLLCVYINKKDINKEPIGLLMLIFFLGFMMALPVIFLEFILGDFFPTDNVLSFYRLFFNIFISIALVEEGAKWIVTRHVGFTNKEFDEIYDIIVYAVFSSLGFACIENIFYVLNNGIFVAIIRAVLSVPGHMCFGVLMGYFLAKARVSLLHKNKKLYIKNMVLSILIPSFAHSLYDALLFYNAVANELAWLIVFLFYFVMLFIVSFKMVNYVADVQKKLSKTNFKLGKVVK